MKGGGKNGKGAGEMAQCLKRLSHKCEDFRAPEPTKTLSGYGVATKAGTEDTHHKLAS